MTDCGQRFEHLGRDSQTSWGQRAVNIEEAYCILDWAILEIRVELGHFDSLRIRE